MKLTVDGGPGSYPICLDYISWYCSNINSTIKSIYEFSKTELPQSQESKQIINLNNETYEKEVKIFLEKQ